MKTNYILLLLIIILLHGCSSEKHLEFNNIPINGNLDKFANELIKLGFYEPKLIQENQIKVNGMFLEKKCEVYIYGAKKSQTVYKVRVNLPKGVHDSLEYNFHKLQKLYSTIYGRGTSEYQQYQNADRFLFNEPRRTIHLRRGDFTKYTIDSGYITLEVQEGYISITYLDKLNNEIRKGETGEEKRQETIEEN